MVWWGILWGWPWPWAPGPGLCPGAAMGHTGYEIVSFPPSSRLPARRGGFHSLYWLFRVGPWASGFAMKVPGGLGRCLEGRPGGPEEAAGRPFPGGAGRNIETGCAPPGSASITLNRCCMSGGTTQCLKRRSAFRCFSWSGSYRPKKEGAHK